MCEGYAFFDCTPSFLSLFIAFSVYSLPPPKWCPCGVTPIKIHIVMHRIPWDDIISKRSKIWKSIIQYYTPLLQATLFSTHPQCYLAFSWIELQMLFRCCLLSHHYTFYILYLVHFCPTWDCFRLCFSFSCSGYDLTLIKKSRTLNCYSFLQKFLLNA